MPNRPIGQSMIEAKLITEQQLTELLESQTMSGERILLGKLSVESGIVDEENFAVFLAGYFDVEYLDLKDCSKIQPEALVLVPESMAKRLNILPIAKEKDTLTVAMSDPIDLNTIENVETVTGCHVKPVVSSDSQIQHSIPSVYYHLLNKITS